LCGTADFDTKIAVYNPGSACPPLDEDLLDCNEDAGTCANSTSEILFDVEIGQSYLLRLAGFGEISPGEEGSGTFNVEEFVPLVANDFCSSAFTVFVGTDQAFESIGATTDGPIHDSSNPCFQFNDPTIQSDIWYTFTPEFTGPVLWSTCNSANFDTRLGVYGPNIECGDLVNESLYACNDDGAACDAFSSALFFEVVEGQTYLLRLGGFGGEAGTGTFDLINQTPPEPPANDLCENAIDIGDINIAEPVVGTTINSSFDPSTFEFPPCLTNTNGGEFAEVWYTFNNAGSEEVILQFFSGTQDAAFFIDIWESCTTPTDTLLVLDNCAVLSPDISNNVIDTLGLLANVPTNYYLRISTRLTSDLPGDFEFVLMPVDITNSYETPEALAGDVEVSPNPVKNSLNLEIPLNTKSDISLSVKNMLGQTMLNRNVGELASGISNQYLDVSSLSPGIYILHISINDKPVGIKFIKE